MYSSPRRSSSSAPSSRCRPGRRRSRRRGWSRRSSGCGRRPRASGAPLSAAHAEPVGGDAAAVTDGASALGWGVVADVGVGHVEDGVPEKPWVRATPSARRTRNTRGEDRRAERVPPARTYLGGEHGAHVGHLALVVVAGEPVARAAGSRGGGGRRRRAPPRTRHGKGVTTTAYTRVSRHRAQRRADGPPEPWPARRRWRRAPGRRRWTPRPPLRRSPTPRRRRWRAARGRARAPPVRPRPAWRGRSPRRPSARGPRRQGTTPRSSSGFLPAGSVMGAAERSRRPLHQWQPLSRRTMVFLSLRRWLSR